MDRTLRKYAIVVIGCAIGLYMWLFIRNDAISPAWLFHVLRNLDRPDIKLAMSTAQGIAGLALRSGILPLLMAVPAALAIWRPENARPLAIGIMFGAMVTITATLLTFLQLATSGVMHWAVMSVYLALPAVALGVGRRIFADANVDGSVTIGTNSRSSSVPAMDAPGAQTTAGARAATANHHNRSTQETAMEANYDHGDTARPSAMNRYRQGYQVAEWLVSLGSVLRGIGWALAGVGGLVACVAFLGGRGSIGGGKIVGIIAAISALMGWTTFYIWGTLVSANGQQLQSSLDSAVNTSPFLTTEEKAKSMSLRT